MRNDANSPVHNSEARRTEYEVTPTAFHLPKKVPAACPWLNGAILYDREHQKEELIAALSRCCTSSDHRVQTVNDVESHNSGSYASTAQLTQASRSYYRPPLPAAAAELVVVTGASGNGKTALVTTVLQSAVQECRGFFLRGKYDAMETTENFAPMLQALSQLVPMALRDEEKNRTANDQSPESDTMAQSIRSYLSSTDVPMLTQVLPSVKDLVSSSSTVEEKSAGNDEGKGRETETPPRQGGGTLPGMHQNRLVYVLRQFLLSICSPTRPIVLFLDDLQWAEPASLDLLAALLGGDGATNVDCIQGLLIVGACRDNEVSMHHNLSVTLRELEADGVFIANVHVNDMDEVAITSIVEDTFQALPVQDKSSPTSGNGDNGPDVERTSARTVANFLFRHTRGNVFFLLQLLRALVEESLLCRLGDEGWIWKPEDYIKSRLSCEDVTLFLNSKLSRLSQYDQRILMMASCFGAEFDEGLFAAMLPDTEDAASLLHLIEQKGLVQYSTYLKRWRFAHDQIQHSSYSLITENEREAFHLNLGRQLLEGLGIDRRGQYTPLILNQFRLGAALITDQEERDELAIFMLRAGEKATTSSKFKTAQSYLDFGISLLGSRHWRDEYHLSLDLFNAAAEVEYCNANYTRLDDLIAEVIANARDESDKVRALTLSMYSHGSRNDLQQAIDLGFGMLRDLEEPFPKESGIVKILLELQRTKRMLRKMSDERILRLSNMDDDKKLAAQRIMSIMFSYALNGRPLFGPLIAMRLVRLTITHGLSGMSSVGFATFGMLLCNGFNDVELGLRCGKLALRIVDKLQAVEWIARVYPAVYGFCLPWREPLRAHLKPLLVSHRCGLARGDNEFAMMSSATYAAVGLHASMPLPHLLSEMEAFRALMEAHDQSNMIQFLRPNMQFVLNMMGQSKDPLLLDGDAMRMKEAMQEALGTKNATVEAILLLLDLLVKSFFHDYTSAEQLATKLSRVPRTGIFPSYVLANLDLHSGLASAALVTSPGGSRRQKRRRWDVARKSLRRLKSIASQSRENYLHKAYIIEAELYAAKGRIHQALAQFEMAIEFALAGEVWCDVGLACERAAAALNRAGRHVKATSYLERGVQAYGRWGAMAKVLSLRRCLPVIADVGIDHSPMRSLQSTSTCPGSK